MLPLFALIVALATTNAEELSPAALEGFQASFYGTIMQHLNAEFEVLEPSIRRQNETMERCKSSIVTAQGTCRSCAQSKCQGDIGDWIGQQWGTVTDWFEGAGETFVDWQGWQDLGGFFGDVGNWFAGAGSTFINWNGWGDMGDFFGNLGSDIGNFFGDAGDFIVGGFSDIGNGIGDVFGSIGGGIASLFGRRRRSISQPLITARSLEIIRHKYIAKRMEDLDPKTRQCMQQCGSCQPFLGDQTAMIGGVCGDQVLLDQAAMAEVMGRMEGLFKANGNPQEGTQPILRKVEYDRRRIDFTTLKCGGVYVTALTPNGVETYSSRYQYDLLNPAVTKGELAMELLEKWGL